MHRPFVFGDQGVELFRFKKLNHVRNVFILLKFEGHFRTLFGTGNFTEFCGRIFEVIGQEGLVGDKTLVTRGLVSLAVFVSIDGTAVATDSASQAWADLVYASIDTVAGSAAFKKFLAIFGITGNGRDSGKDDKGRGGESNFAGK
tara:strand:+ start:1218 stop:1652 length:435 start_codon:yes stop_codon:yes gene_type:complete